MRNPEYLHMAELRPNRAKEKLANGQIVTCLAGVDSPHLIDFVGQIGIDSVWLEAEHGSVDFEAIGDLSRAADLWGVTPLVRVGNTDYNTIYRTLDMGAMGITVPHVDTAQDARDVVYAAMYAPIGGRGMFGPRQAFGVTEPTAGTDTTSISTVAVRSGDGYIVNGQKVWTSRAEHSDLMILLARTTPKDQVEKRSDGLSAVS